MACGLGTDSVVKVACNDNGQMSIEALRAEIRKACINGHVPLFACATAGTTVLGAFDDISGMASVCREYRLWLHIDASWGGPAIFSPTTQHLFLGSHFADSVTINPHKLLGIPHQCSFLLFGNKRSASRLKVEAPYLFHLEKLAESPRSVVPLLPTKQEAPKLDQATKTLGCGRRPDAFKFYLAWKRHGSHGFGQRITNALKQAQKLRDYLVDKTESLQLELGSVPSPPFLQVCFRPIPPWTSNAAHADNLSNACIVHVHASFKNTRFAVDFAPMPNTTNLYIR